MIDGLILTVNIKIPICRKYIKFALKKMKINLENVKKIKLEDYYENCCIFN